MSFIFSNFDQIILKTKVLSYAEMFFSLFFFKYSSYCGTVDGGSWREILKNLFEK